MIYAFDIRPIKLRKTWAQLLLCQRATVIGYHYYCDDVWYSTAEINNGKTEHSFNHTFEQDYFDRHGRRPYK